ncbi:MAG: hypothetical protein JXA54_00300 [Candidatus Heimdallarchaeota archaeon]|nr:hypothetical protein [Candidatus Heimdallarchaeota archaeon]
MSGNSEKDVCYHKFFTFHCPRPIKAKNDTSHSDIFKDCLFKNWEPVITEIVKELCTDPPMLNQIIKGRTGEREFNKEPLDELITLVETKVKAKLRVTTGGIDFYKEGKSTSIKALTFCILGCQLLQIANEHWRLSKIKTKILNVLLVHYYLDGINITNATLHDIERIIEKRENALKNNQEDALLDEALQEDDSFSEIEEDDESFDIFSEDTNFIERVDKEKVVVCQVNSPLLLPRDTLKQIDLFTIDNYFLEGDQELTDVLQEICSNDECDSKRCITCDVTNEFYFLAAQKLIHLFIYQNELFDNINLSAECLLQYQIDVTDLRRRVELMFRQDVPKWELTSEQKNKFILCTICHLIRHFKLLGQFNTMESIETFFKYRQQIFSLSETQLITERTKIMEALKLDTLIEPYKTAIENEKIVNDQLPKQEPIFQFTKPTSHQQQMEIIQFLEALASQINESKESPIKIIHFKHKAEQLITQEENDIFAWIPVFQAHSQDNRFLPFLADAILKHLENNQRFVTVNERNKEELFDDTISDFSNLTKENILVLKSYEKKCKDCKKSISECGNLRDKAYQLITSSKEKLSKIWRSEVTLRSCLAKELLESQKEKIK